MSAYLGTLVIHGMTAAVHPGRGGPVGGSTMAGPERLQRLVGPSFSWQALGLVLSFLLALALMSAVVSTLAWTGSRRTRKVRSVGVRRPH